VFCYSAAAILALLLLFGIRFERDLRNSPLWFRAANVVLAVNMFSWSALGFALLFYSSRFSPHMRIAFSHLWWISTGITLGMFISLGFSRFFKREV